MTYPRVARTMPGIACVGVALCVSLVILTPASALASGRYDPRLRFQTISTTRFSFSSVTDCSR